jgi:hypothetical protein
MSRAIIVMITGGTTGIQKAKALTWAAILRLVARDLLPV